jgi:hypothetical protein
MSSKKPVTKPTVLGVPFSNPKKRRNKKRFVVVLVSS